MNKKAVTLVEVMLACLILALAIIPLVSNSQQSAVRAIETEKIQIAERILESVKSEMMTMKFDTYYQLADLEHIDKKAVGPFPLSDGYYPVTLLEVMKVQEKYKDFTVEGSWRWNETSDGKPDKTIINAEVTCAFSTATSPNHEPIVRKKAFLIVKP